MGAIRALQGVQGHCEGYCKPYRVTEGTERGQRGEKHVSP